MLVMASDLDEDAGPHNMILRIAQTDYSKSYDQTFVAEFFDCTITGITVSEPAQTTFTYDLLDTPVALDVFYPSIAVVPDYCAYGFVYVAKI